MLNKLKNMKYSSVDMVKRGANPLADIKLAKSADSGKGGESEMKVNKSVGDAFSFCFALNESFAEIINDPKLDMVKKQEEMNDCLADFCQEVARQFGDWADNQTDKSKFALDDKQLEALQRSIDVLHALARTVPQLDEGDEDEEGGEGGTCDPKTQKQKTSKGDFCKKAKEEFDMAVIDVSKMSPEDLEILKELEKKYVAKGGTSAATAEVSVSVQKALDSALGEVAELKKKLELQDMMEIAKKYEVIGKKAEDTAKMLLALKPNKDAFDSVVKALDEMADLAKKSEVFKEFGSNKSGDGSNLSSIVAEIRKAAPDLSYEQAVVRAYETTPGLDPMTGQFRS